MDPQSRSGTNRNLVHYSLVYPPVPFEDDVEADFPMDLSSASECRLLELCDGLFRELDSEMPDLRAIERYQAVCDELTLRHIDSGVA